MPFSGRSASSNPRSGRPVAIANIAEYRDVEKSLCSVAEEIFSIYGSLVSEREFAHILAGPGVVGSRLRLLSSIIKGSPTLDNFTYEEAITFQETLLDAIALQGATGMQRLIFGDIELGEPSLLGRSRDRSSLLKAEDERQLDWHFSLLVQGWASSNGFGPLKDLRGDQRFKRSEVCDFALPATAEAVELLECKPVHPAVGKLTGANPALMTKISRALSKSADQFEQTARRLESAVACRHVLIDISAHSDQPYNVPSRFGRIQTAGFSKDEIDHLADFVRVYLLENCLKIDKVTLCWRTLVLINGKARAIVQNPMIAFVSSPKQSIFDYGGPSRGTPYRRRSIASFESHLLSDRWIG